MEVLPLAFFAHRSAIHHNSTHTVHQANNSPFDTQRECVKITILDIQVRLAGYLLSSTQTNIFRLQHLPLVKLLFLCERALATSSCVEELFFNK
jgi:hypothetical protein